MAECRAQGLFSGFMSDHFCDLGYSGCTSIPTLAETQVKKTPKNLKIPNHIIITNRSWIQVDPSPWALPYTPWLLVWD